MYPFSRTFSVLLAQALCDELDLDRPSLDMIVYVRDVLTAKKLATLPERARLLPFVLGEETADSRAQRVKKNELISEKAEGSRVFYDIVPTAPARSSEFKGARKASVPEVRPTAGIFNSSNAGNAVGLRSADSFLRFSTAVASV